MTKDAAESVSSASTNRDASTSPISAGDLFGLGFNSFVLQAVANNVKVKAGR
jgi:hypothetical protein